MHTKELLILYSGTRNQNKKKMDSLTRTKCGDQRSVAMAEKHSDASSNDVQPRLLLLQHSTNAAPAALLLARCLVHHWLARLGGLPLKSGQTVYVLSGILHCLPVGKCLCASIYRGEKCEGP